MKRQIFLITILFSMCFSGCAKSKASAAPKTEPVQEAQPAAIESVKYDPKIEKLNRVLMSMTDRCKEAIPNGDPAEFLADLEKVLEVEKAFPADDLSLYFLIDKTHKVGSDYEPKHLRKLVANDDYIINKTTLALR